MTAKNYEQFKATFESFSDESKWKLSTGRFVEEYIFAYAMNLENESSLHSFILDLDKIPADTFTVEEIEQIKANAEMDFPEEPDTIYDFFNKIDASNVESFRDSLSKMFGLWEKSEYEEIKNDLEWIW